MISELCLFSLLFLCYESRHSSTTHSFHQSGKIVGGEETTIEKYPFIVSLQKKGFGHYCGGTILSSKWILSAAHCCLDEKRKILPQGCCYIMAGSTDATMVYSPTVQMIEILGYVYHPDYHKSRYMNDIACIKLNSSLIYTPQVKAVQLPKSYKGDLGDLFSDAIVIGWGVSVPTRYGNFLKEVTLPIMPYKACKAKVRYLPVKETHVCTLYTPGGRDCCYGDSGGPLLDPKNVEYGIVSFGKGCAQRNQPSVYTRVDKYLDFISDCKMELMAFSGSTCPFMHYLLFTTSTLFTFFIFGLLY